MKNTLPMKLRALSFVYRVLMSSPVRWAGGVLTGAVVSSLVVFLMAPIMVFMCGSGAAWFLYMSVFDQAGIKRLADRAEARKSRQGNPDDELRDQVSTN